MLNFGVCGGSSDLGVSAPIWQGVWIMRAVFSTIEKIEKYGFRSSSGPTSLLHPKGSNNKIENLLKFDWLIGMSGGGD